MNWRRFVGRKAKDSELAEEIQSHLAHDEDLRRARGVDAEEARRQARVKFGATEHGARAASGATVPCPGWRRCGAI